MLKDYFLYQKKYTDKYGTKTIVLFQSGSFFELYQTKDEGYNLKELSNILNIAMTKKNKK